MGIESSASLLCGKVMHRRLFPRKNHFVYGIYYIALSLSRKDEWPIAYNRFSALSFYDRDHGECDGSDLEVWARDILSAYGLNDICEDITLICMPRVFGYVFNPVSFWMCRDDKGTIRAVLCEVHNTFGEKHSYVCAHDDLRPILPSDVLEGQKIFHVSPFLERSGHYEFRFDFSDEKFKAYIDYFDQHRNKQLVTSLVCDVGAMNRSTLNTVFWAYPLITLKAVILIHWQAFKLVAKGIKYISRPLQLDERVSAVVKLTKK
tara:strand:+ start:49 stop:834 length:786 start_codon:yes stop_codon:yes gene_type:complete